MNRLLIIVIICFGNHQLFATGQAAERIIYEGDTLELLSLPLEDILGEYEERIKKYPSLKGMCSTGLWRNYIGYWKIENSKLYLIDVFKCGEHANSLLEEIFDQVSPIKADWYTGKLFIQHGKQIKYQHSGFERYYEQETVITIEQGRLKNKEFFTNGYLKDDPGFSCEADSIMAKVHNMIKWEELPELSKDFKIYVSLTTGAKDSLSIIKSKAPELYADELNRVLEEFSELKKFYSRGEPVRERFAFPVIFSEEQRKRFDH
ncbi:hypothetical protein MATR_14310 [Marivirga tractuosa]|uniref:TonB C-terminal domain-containing protein n=1 Tax=Marivirga tractuosa (strain ATCC 23168 / DSM 4126 / NBRC 15989 / NCIMB 1408 / VKM B-1430 / H-43) TaxID=643867 RepID=E4TTM6_MARTH|nr:hypothetical protein [Marivirga tractuosa]ADR20943.1 hypothetical protein Ftrac_0941 [Marivirga tractuosa DSM 4126]BDD14606.1 hypothetical protein MATR_14310 [Marivirga tractuosa]